MYPIIHMNIIIIIITISRFTFTRIVIIKKFCSILKVLYYSLLTSFFSNGQCRSYFHPTTLMLHYTTSTSIDINCIWLYFSTNDLMNFSASTMFLLFDMWIPITALYWSNTKTQPKVLATNLYNSFIYYESRYAFTVVDLQRTKPLNPIPYGYIGSFLILKNC